MYKTQLEFTRKFFKEKHGIDLSDIEKDKVLQIKWNKEYILALIKECTEILDELDWKMHTTKTSEEVHDNILEECIDVQKYLLGLMILNGFDREQIEQKFFDKSAVVEAKFQQEASIKKIKESKQPIVFCDIDGVLADWPGEMIRFASKIERQNLCDVRYMQKQLGRKRMNEIQKQYRLSGIKARMRLKEFNCGKVLKRLKEEGFAIILITARPYKKIFRIYSDTLIWLKDSDIPFDAIIWENEKEKYIINNFDTEQVTCIIDDNIDNIKKLDECNFKTYCVFNALLSDTVDKKGNIISDDKLYTKFVNKIENLELYDCKPIKSLEEIDEYFDLF